MTDTFRVGEARCPQCDREVATEWHDEACLYDLEMAQVEANKNLIRAAQRVVAQFGVGALIARPGDDDEWVRVGIAALNDALPEPSRVVIPAHTPTPEAS